jgi:hypothetical protein
MKFTKDGKYFVIPSNNFTDSKFCVKIYDVNDFHLKGNFNWIYTTNLGFGSFRTAKRSALLVMTGICLGY